MTFLTNLFLLAEEQFHFTLYDAVRSLTIPGWIVVITLIIMSIYMIAIAVERMMTFNKARTQSRQFAPRVAKALKDNQIEEAINISDKHKASHLAMVVASGLQEFKAHEDNPELHDELESSKRALQRAIAIKTT